MDWFEAIIGALGGGLLTFISTVIYFRPKLKEARAEAQKAEAEANAATFEHLMERINKMDELYTQQSKTIDDLRAKILELGNEKMERDEKIMQQENTIKILSVKVDELTKEVEAYKIIANKK